MDLPILSDFADATDPGRYVALPGDWSLGICDIVGSTKLANSGRHRDVNFVAAASIAALQAEITAILPGPVACQFGGDGALVAVPPEAAEAVRRCLAALAHWADKSFGLMLRVGMVRVSDLAAEGAQVLAALYRVGHDTYYGQFLGGGTLLLEARLKAGGLAPIDPCEGRIAGLDGLSCRWEPVASAKGTILCLIADPVAGGAEGAGVIARLRQDIEAIAPIDQAAPLGDGLGLAPRLQALPAALRRELRLEQGMGKFGRMLRALVGTGVVWLLFRYGGRLGRFDARAYVGRIARQTDFRRVSTGLKLVLDVSEDAALRIETLLAKAHAAGTLRYGTHRCQSAAITCLVHDVMAGGHIHFVDGGGLGLWQAAAALKAQAAS